MLFLRFQIEAFVLSSIKVRLPVKTLLIKIISSWKLTMDQKKKKRQKKDKKKQQKKKIVLVIFDDLRPVLYWLDRE